jgi:hypothetical protein
VLAWAGHWAACLPGAEAVGRDPCGSWDTKGAARHVGWTTHQKMDSLHWADHEEDFQAHGAVGILGGRVAL